MIRVLGADPDLHNTAFAVVEFDGQVGTLVEVVVAEVKRHAGCLDDEAVVAMCRGAGIVLDQLMARYERFDLGVVEGQHVRFGKSPARPKDIINLAQVAGGVVAEAAVHCDVVWIPTPPEWKGQKPKPVDQSNTMRELGIRFIRTGDERDDYCYPAGCAKAAKVRGYQQTIRSHWKHLGDAAGLALWGARKFTQLSKNKPRKDGPKE